MYFPLRTRCLCKLDSVFENCARYALNAENSHSLLSYTVCAMFLRLGPERVRSSSMGHSENIRIKEYQLLLFLLD